MKVLFQCMWKRPDTTQSLHCRHMVIMPNLQDCLWPIAAPNFTYFKASSVVLYLLPSVEKQGKFCTAAILILYIKIPRHWMLPVSSVFITIRHFRVLPVSSVFITIRHFRVLPVSSVFITIRHFRVLPVSSVFITIRHFRVLPVSSVFITIRHFRVLK